MEFIIGIAVVAFIIFALWSGWRKSRKNSSKKLQENELALAAAYDRLMFSNQIYLDANRQGKFTEGQTRAIKDRANGFRWKDLGLLVAAVIVAFVITNFAGTLFHMDANSILLVTIGPLLLAVIAAILWIRKKNQERFNNILQGGIDSSFGKYTFDFRKKKYVAHCGERTLEPIMAPLLEPGTYRFYFAAQANLLLAAEPCESQYVPAFNSITDALPAVLARTLGFEASDLSANRNGQLSEGQKSKLKKTLLLPFGTIAACLVLALAIMFMIIGEGGSYVLVPLLIPVVVALLLFRHIYRIFSDLRAGTVAAATGRGWTEKYGEKSLSASALDIISFIAKNAVLDAIFSFIPVFKQEKFRYQIGEQTFEVSPSCWKAFGHGFIYKAFYTPHTHRLLSIERIQD
jgi:hypothetical protein